MHTLGCYLCVDGDNGMSCSVANEPNKDVRVGDLSILRQAVTSRTEQIGEIDQQRARFCPAKKIYLQH
jgi:hypothetical protein